MITVISDYRKVTGYEVQIEKSVTFPYTGTGEAELTIKNSAPFISADPKVK